MKLWAARGQRSRIMRECAALTCMCAHMWRACKEEAAWLKGWGLLPEEHQATLDLPPQPARLAATQQDTFHTVVATFSATISWQTLPAWLLADLGMDQGTSEVVPIADTAAASLDAGPQLATASPTPCAELPQERFAAPAKPEHTHQRRAQDKATCRHFLCCACGWCTGGMPRCFCCLHGR